MRWHPAPPAAPDPRESANAFLQGRQSLPITGDAKAWLIRRSRKIAFSRGYNLDRAGSRRGGTKTSAGDFLTLRRKPRMRKIHGSALPRLLLLPLESQLDRVGRRLMQPDGAPRFDFRQPLGEEALLPPDSVS